ncbi:helix-turn-helix transcriptional regulator [Cupriavidus basilensis]|uniref:Helix-turn-helix transcriptional regulator n=1 Tax=Cupriavidus basilensis TaxID=68895 RepID=A0ABT6ATS0_9BURK|nr:helix-turn-helix transcriptional regulator [Cupriavidus basilensis]MDF3836030.1 helix-turn-helix transcriptional regulator [Cupriavidus basilensis]
MRNTLLDPYEDIPRSVVVTANDYPAASTFPAHAHRRGQFAYAACGTISVQTPGGSWLVPPQRACWIPVGVVHEMQMSGPVTMLNTFVAADAARAAGLPDDCRVFGVSPLLRHLLAEAVDLPALYQPDARAGKIMSLLLDEIAVMPSLSLHAPLPAEPRLARLCRDLLASPSLGADIDKMAARAGMSRRTFTRTFRAQTGVSFTQWRQQACLLSALERLGNGESVTRVALDLGYGSPSAFTALFRRVLGQSPSRYLERQR